MSNSNFNTVSPGQVPKDPSKRVKYTMGLVLGVEEFEQEQYYLMERDRLHQRALHGYGTVAGLKVSVVKESGVPNVRVSPGTAVNPGGDTICVPDDQCASLADWLKDNAAEVEAQLGKKTSGTASLYVVLCYKECPTDNVPIPGAPCQSKEDIMAPSRIADYFELFITATPPDQVEEEYVRCFGKFLRRIEISKHAPNPLDKDQLVKELQELFIGMGSPPECPLDDEASPPDIVKYYISPDSAVEILEAVFRAWVTDIRPVLLEKAGVCKAYSGKPEVSGACVLLSQLDVKVKKSGGTWKVDEPVEDMDIIEDRRPVLLHTRLLQEWLLFGGYYPLKPDTHTFASLVVRMPDTIRAWVHHPVLLEIPLDALKIEINSFMGPLASAIDRIPNTNVFDISLNLPKPIAVLLKQTFEYNTMVKVGFDVTKISEITGASPPEKLSEVLERLDYTYLDRDGDFLWSYSNVAYPYLDNLVDVNVPKPKPGQVLTWNKKGKGGQWIAGSGVITDHGKLDGLGDDDHDQYFNQERGDGRYAQIGHTHVHTHDLSLDDLSDVEIDQEKIDTNHVLIFTKKTNNWTSSLLDHNSLTGRDVNNAHPQYALKNHVHGAEGLSIEDVAEKLPVLPFVTIKYIGTAEGNLPLFELWFHLNTTDQMETVLNDIGNVQVFRETGTGEECGLENMEPVNLGGECNVYRVSLGKPLHGDDKLRFVFMLSAMTITTDKGPSDLMKWVRDWPMKWVGHDGAETVTAFYKHSPPEVETVYKVVAAGKFKFDGQTIVNDGPALNNLTANVLDILPEIENKTIFRLHFNDYNDEKNYIVKGTPLVNFERGIQFTFVVDDGTYSGHLQDSTMEPGEVEGIYAAVIGPKSFSGFMVEIREIS